MTEERLAPTGGKTWMDLLPPDADAFHQELYEALDAGLVELWQTHDGHILARDTTDSKDYVILRPRRPPSKQEARHGTP